jgi:hypothetical protein
MGFLPEEFTPPAPLETHQFRLTLLAPKHCDSDYAAWTSSMDFIRTLPGWAGSKWPYPMTIEDNLRDCETHLSRSTAGLDFAYTVLLPDRDEVIGCVYFMPTRPPRAGSVHVRSWVTAEQSALDKPLHDAVDSWLSDEWPWSDVEYASRD